MEIRQGGGLAESRSTTTDSFGLASISGYARRGARLTAPKEPLLYVPTHPAREMDIDLKVAGIPKHAPGGKVDFHAARVAYINLVLETGVHPKEAQTLARHSTPEMTMNVYGRTRKENLSDAVEQVANEVETHEKYAPSMHRLAVGAEQESATSNADKELRSIKNGGGGVHHILAITHCYAVIYIIRLSYIPPAIPPPAIIIIIALALLQI
jgi:hypothetical protein